MNKYEKWYKNIIQSATARQHTEYTERHHIMPRSLGGSDDADNLVSLTAREHFVCHWLLTKIYPTGEEHWRMLNAFRMMRAKNPKQQRYQTKITARVYANLKEEYSKLQSEKVSGSKNPMYGDKFYRSLQGRENQRQAVLGDKNGSKQESARVKISNNKRGKKRPQFNDEWRAKLSLAKQGTNNNMYGKTHSEETKEKMRERALGRKQSPETVKRKADAVRGSKREKKLCPHCQQLIAVNGFARWHGDNCKKKGPNYEN